VGEEASVLAVQPVGIRRRRVRIVGSYTARWSSESAEQETRSAHSWYSPSLLLFGTLFFLYVGVETSVGSWTALYAMRMPHLMTPFLPLQWAASGWHCSRATDQRSATPAGSRTSDLHIPYTISINGLGIKSSFLINTGANSYTFINTKLIKLIERFLGVKPQPLPLPCTVYGFNRKPAESVKKYIEVLLLING